MTDLADGLAEIEDIAGRLAAPEPKGSGDVGPALLGADALAASIADGTTIFLAATESDHRALVALGIPSCTTEGGLHAWTKESAPALAAPFKGAEIVVLSGEYPAKAPSVCTALKAAGARLVKLLTLPDHAPVWEWERGQESPVDALYAFAETLEAYTGRKSRLKPVTWDRIDAKGEQHEWLVKGLLTRGELSMLAGPSQSGKSFLAIDLALAIARGVAWFGRKVRRGGVVYQAGESAKGVRRKRLPAYRTHHRCATESVPFVLLQSPVNLHASDDDTQAMIDECLWWKEEFGEAGLELVVIDTFSAATPGANENASEDMSRVLARCQRIAERTGAAVLLVHHMNALGEKPRGHTSIFANLDSVLLCRKDENRKDLRGRQIREMKVAKAKDGEADYAVRFVLPAVTIGFDEDGEKVTSCIVEEPQMGGADGLPALPQGWKLSRRVFDLFTDIEMALEKHGVPAPPEARLPIHMAAVHENALKRVIDSQWTGGEDDADKRKTNQRQYYSRGLRELMREGLVAKNENLIWRTEKQVTRYGRINDPVTASSSSVTQDADPVTSDDYHDDLPLPEFARP